MKFGLAVVPKLPLADLAALSAAAERGGFASLWVPDERFFRDVFVSLTAVAGSTERVAIAPGITDPFIRHPLLTATAIASVDELSGGRAVLGLGAGVSGFEGRRLVVEPTESLASVLRERLLLTGTRACRSKCCGLTGSTSCMTARDPACPSARSRESPRPQAEASSRTGRSSRRSLPCSRRLRTRSANSASRSLASG